MSIQLSICGIRPTLKILFVSVLLPKHLFSLLGVVGVSSQNKSQIRVGKEEAKQTSNNGPMVEVSVGSEWAAGGIVLGGGHQIQDKCLAKAKVKIWTNLGQINYFRISMRVAQRWPHKARERPPHLPAPNRKQVR